MRELGLKAGADCRAYLTGGASAVLVGWRSTTIDVDIKLVPEDDAAMRALPHLKDELSINVELAAPSDFVPPPPGWEERSPYIAREGRLSFHHFDFYGQALAKVERGHEQDLADVREMIDRGLVEPDRALALFGEIEPELYRYPAVDPVAFRAGVEAAFSGG
jgi:hypothetical protein